jgi:hypothetical protein
MMKALEMKARVAEIDQLLELNDRERSKVNDEIERLTARRDAMLAERDSMRLEQTSLLHKLASDA